MYMARENSGSSLTTIAGAFGGRNHTTALNACKKVEKRIAADTELASELRELTDRLFKTAEENRSDRAQ
jgi:chromosomal replication initiator protein